jgi:hypothetical protein
LIQLGLFVWHADWVVMMKNPWPLNTRLMW